MQYLSKYEDLQDELVDSNIINYINIEKYNEMKPYIEENFKIANEKYKKFKFNETEIINAINN